MAIQTSRTIFSEAVGCGCAFIDYDNNGWMDIFLVEQHEIRWCSAGVTNRLYKNNRDGTFSDVTDKSVFEMSGGLPPFVLVTTTMTASTILFITYFGQINFTNRLYHNDDKGNFEGVSRAAKIEVETRNTCWGAGMVDAIQP
jgi:hypothetical protein